MGVLFLFLSLFLFLVHDVYVCLCLYLCLCLCVWLCAVSLFLVRTGQDKTDQDQVKAWNRPHSIMLELNWPRTATIDGGIVLPIISIGSSFQDSSRRQQIAGLCWSRWDGMMGYGLELADRDQELPS